MDRRMTLALLALMIGITPALAGRLWETDFPKAAESAQASNRYMLLDFSGSDWCGWCIKLDNEVFSRNDFEKYAKQELVCVLLDFPRGKSLKKSLAEQNKELAAKYKVSGFPTVVVLDPGGDVVARTGYREGGAKEYVRYLQGVIDPHRKKNNVPAATSTPTGRQTKPALSLLSAQRPEPLARDENREVRTWTSKSGASLAASLLEEQSVSVVLRKEDGSIVKIPTTRLSDEDRAYIAGLKQTQTAPPE